MCVCVCTYECISQRILLGCNTKVFISWSCVYIYLCTSYNTPISCDAGNFVNSVLYRMYVFYENK